MTSNHHSKIGSKINLTIKRAASDVQASGQSDEVKLRLLHTAKFPRADKLEPLAVSVGEATRLAGVVRCRIGR